MTDAPKRQKLPKTPKVRTGRGVKANPPGNAQGEHPDERKRRLAEITRGKR